MIPRVALAEPLARCVDPAAPEELRIDAARGTIPLSPADRLSTLLILLADPVPAVREEAHSAWVSLPQSFLEEALSDPRLPTPVVDLVAALEADRAELLYRTLDHPCLGPESVARFLESRDEQVLIRLAGNQRLLCAHPDLGLKLLENPCLPAAERGRLESLFRPEQEGEAAPEDGEIERIAGQTELPRDLPAELLDDTGAAHAEPSKDIYGLVQTLSVAEKIKLATMGSKSARRLLMRDTNRIVAVAVVRSPKIREDEVLAIAQDRTVVDEVLRVILTRKDWLKSYPIRLALCQNPKTVLPRAIRLLETLQDKDLRQISKSRNVPKAVATGALRVLARRGKV